MGWVERQLPEGDEIFLDHVGFFVEDIETINAALQRLGFIVTPVNTHYNADADGNLTKSGTANRLCTFKLGYFEVLGTVADTPLADQLKAALYRYRGLHLVAFTHTNLDVQRNRLLEAGFDMQPTVRLRRSIQTPEGEKTVRASVLRTKPGVMAEGRVQMLTHETPELIWLPGYSQHPNAADALTDLLIVSEDASKKAKRYARFTNRSVTAGKGADTVSLARGRLTFATPKAAEVILPALKVPALPYIAAVGIRSTDLNQTRNVLRERGITPLTESDTAICVGPKDGVGAYIVFHSPNVESIWSHIC